MHNNSIKAITDFLFYETRIPKKVDIVFVLWNNYLDTMKELSILLKTVNYNKILITGGAYLNKKKEADLFKEQGLKLGVKEENLILESNATNTKENIIFSRQILEDLDFRFKYKKILFVCKSFHTRRVLMTLNNYFFKDIKFYFYPLQDGFIDKENWFKNEGAKKRILEELIRIWEYSINKDLY